MALVSSECCPMSTITKRLKGRKDVCPGLPSMFILRGETQPSKGRDHGHPLHAQCPARRYPLHVAHLGQIRPTTWPILLRGSSQAVFKTL